MSRKLKWTVLTAVTAVSLGFGLGWRGQRVVLEPAPAFAACQSPNLTCGIGGVPDATKTSLMSARYVETGVGPVLPDAATTWNITANWSTAPLGCADHSETATATVTWDGSSAAWTLTNTSLTTNIVGISMCNTTDCASTAAGYTLYVDIADPAVVGANNYNLRSVDYTSTGTLPDGTLCGGGSRTPVTDPVSGADSGPWGGRCPYNCSLSGGPVITIDYQ